MNSELERISAEVNLSTKVLPHIHDKSIEKILRSIIYADDTVINWDKVNSIILREMPELTM